jgi:hypothetical protein
MENELVSRKTVRDGMMKYGFHAPDMTVHEFVEDELPPVPAVPLDQLCEWLAKNASWYAAEIDGDPEEWKSILMEWMEEQDA